MRCIPHAAFVVAMLLIPMAAAQARTERFAYPDVRKDFCGARISAQYCKCAFHGQMCDAARMSRKAAGDKVNAEFNAYTAERIEAFARSCMNAGGIYSVIKKECEYCEGGKVRSNGLCVAPDEKRDIEEQFLLPKVDTVGGSNAVAWVEEGEGEFFVFSPGRGKWIGPVRRGLTLFEGDVLYTTPHGRAVIKFGGTAMHVLERTMLRLPTPQKERSRLERGALFIWEAVKRVVTNEPFEIEGGAHSITGIKGTKFVMQVDEDGVATYALNEGVIDVWNPAHADERREMAPGQSVRVSEAGIEEVPHDWGGLLRSMDIDENKEISPDEAPAPFPPIDPDAVNPTEAAYSGDLVGTLPRASGRSWLPLLLVIAVAAGGWWYVRARRPFAKAK